MKSSEFSRQGSGEIRRISPIGFNGQAWLAALAALALFASAGMALPVNAGAGEVGWARDGSGIFPDANPPTDFDGSSGKGLKWKTLLPNWGNSSPIVVESVSGAPRVFCMAEPLVYAQILLCFDADTGKELWRRELDVVPLLPEGEREAARRLATENAKMLRAHKRLAVQVGLILEANKEALGGKKKGTGVPAGLEEKLAPLIEEAKALGLTYKGWSSISRGGMIGDLGSVNAYCRDARELRALGMAPSVWEGTPGTWEGVAFPTPVSDGKHVYVMTGHNMYACYDFEGNVVWQKRFPPPKPEDLETDIDKERIARKSNKGRWPEKWTSEHFQTSPRLHAGKLIGGGGQVLRCLDAKTGELIWELPLGGAMRHTMGVPGIIEIDGTTCVITVDEIWNGYVSELVHLDDGVVLGEIPGARNGGNGSPYVLSDGSVVTRVPPGKGVKNCDMVGWALSMGSDGKVVVKERWRVPERDLKGFSLSRAARRGTEIFGHEMLLDGTTGKPIGTGMRRPYKGGSYDGQSLFAGPYLVQCGYYAGEFAFWNRETQELVGTGRVPVNPEDGLPVELIGAQTFRSTWPWLGPAAPFAYKNRFYVRANDFLWCFEGEGVGR